MTIYLTFDHDGERILQNAVLGKYNSEADALSASEEYYEGSDYKVVGLIEGEIGDCWIKWRSDDISEIDLHNLHSDNYLSRDEIVIRRPGQHPGGRELWIDPRPTVYVPVICDK